MLRTLKALIRISSGAAAILVVVWMNVLPHFSARNEVVESPSNRYDTDMERWAIVEGSGQAPTPRHSHSGVEYNHSLYIFAGSVPESYKPKMATNSCSSPN